MGKKRLLLFAGAGASKAVSSGFYPTTADFYRLLPPNILSHSYFQLLQEYLRSRPELRQETDIELVLWYLSELKQQLAAMATTDQLLGWLLDADRLNKPVGGGGHLGAARHAASAGLPLLNGLVDSINRQVFDLYSRKPSDQELDATWTPLLEELSRGGWNLEVVTTNYDVVIERALQRLNLTGHRFVDTGYLSDVFPALDLARWLKRPFGEDQAPQFGGLLTKLHGSVNWSRAGSEILLGDPLFKGTDERHAIIYPGFKGRPAAEPFLTLHQYFRRALSEADAAVFIGFAFRDEYINEICERDTKPSTRVFVVNPAPLSALPFPSQSLGPQIQRGFDLEGIAELLDSLAQA